jgi:hypothetical protein
LVQRTRETLKPLIASDDIQMDGHPVREQQSFTAFAVVGLEISATSFAVVNPEGATFHRETRKAMFISLAERAFGATIAPTCGTTPAAEESKTIRLDPHEPSHARRRSACGAIVAQPAFFVAPIGERDDHAGKIST